MCTSLISILDPISKSSHREQLFSSRLTPHCFAFAAIYPPLCPQTKGGVSHQFIQTPNAHGSSNCKATDASSNYTLLYKNQYFVRPFSCILTSNTHQHMLALSLSLTHTHLDTSHPPPEYNGGHDWGTTPFPPHGEKNKHQCCVKVGGGRECVFLLNQ